MGFASEFTADDRRWMRRALVLARRGWGRTSPNPMVGAVLVHQGVVVGEGYHSSFGGPHAELAALEAAGDRARGATAYVTLEPCNHFGKTPPCAPALIRAGVSRVVFAATDPDPVAQGGADALRAAGIVVETGLETDAALELNAVFHSRFNRERPFVTLKLAMSIDGAIAVRPGASGWLTGAAAQRDVHRMRAAHDAIAVGSGTALADDPALTVRGVPAPRVAPTRIVFDWRGRLPASAQLVRTAREVPVILVTADPAPASADALAHLGVVLIAANDLRTALRALRDRGVDSILCEGGAHLAGALMDAGLVDRLVIFHAPVLLGPHSQKAFAYPTAGPAHSEQWRLKDLVRLGADVKVTYAPAP